MRIIERLLQISIAAMAVLGTWMMSLGGQTPMMTQLMLVAAVCGVVFTDVLRWFQLHRLIVNTVAIAAMVLTLSDFLQRDSTGQLLSIAYLLISWEAVMLFQEKTARVYWCVAVLSLLQVVVASVLNVEVQFGALLLVYLTVSFFGLVFFFLARELHRVESRRRAAARSGAAMVLLAEDSPEALVQRLPLRRLVSAAGAMGLVSTLFAVVFFYGAPRLGGSNWSQQSGGARARTGFTTEVTLREMGEILQSNQRVMRVSFSHYPSGEDYDVFGEPYFHGAVLSRYDNGGWSAPGGFPPLPAASRQLIDTHPRQDFARINVVMEPATDETLFSILPCYRDRKVTPRDVQFVNVKQHLVRNPPPENHGRYRYALITTGYRRGIQAVIRPHRVRVNRTLLTELLPQTRSGELLSIDRQQFPELIRIAQRTVAAMPGATTIQMARLLETHFHDVERYRYTLNFASVERNRDKTLDPIEDFVSNTRAGHCEYYASALTLMLRSQGIPARLVVGYHGGIRNRLAGDMQVLQRHAHAWVEAYLEPDEIRGSLLAAEETRAGGGAWLRLDPTPGGDDTTSERDSLDRVLDYAQLLWNDYVLEMNPDTQRKTLDRALGESSPLRLFDVSAWAAAARQRLGGVIEKLRDWVGGNWFSWRAGVLAMALALAAVSVIRILAPVVAWLRRSWRTRRVAVAKRRVPIEFYVRLERLLKRLRLVRAPDQTHREFAEAASQQMRQVPALAGVADVPPRVTEAFYDVRFGLAALDNRQSAAIERSLEQLAAALRNTSSADLSR